MIRHHVQYCKASKWNESTWYFMNKHVYLQLLHFITNLSRTWLKLLNRFFVSNESTHGAEKIIYLWDNLPCISAIHIFLQDLMIFMDTQSLLKCPKYAYIYYNNRHKAVELDAHLSVNILQYMCTLKIHHRSMQLQQLWINIIYLPIRALKEVCAHEGELHKPWKRLWHSRGQEDNKIDRGDKYLLFP